MSETKLLPCPFCGGEAELVKQKHREYPSTYGINCKGYCIKQYDYENADRAIEAWNTRKPMDDIVERLDKRINFLDSVNKISSVTGDFKEVDKSACRMSEVIAIKDIVRSGGKG